jgi:hypothetical protein
MIGLALAVIVSAVLAFFGIMLAHDGAVSQEARRWVIDARFADENGEFCVMRNIETGEYKMQYAEARK